MARGAWRATSDRGSGWLYRRRLNALDTHAEPEIAAVTDPAYATRGERSPSIAVGRVERGKLDARLPGYPATAPKTPVIKLLCRVPLEGEAGKGPRRALLRDPSRPRENS